METKKQITKSIYPIDIEKELKKSYLEYAMSVIVRRALPDIRDGLKPVHRRILFAMKELNNDFNKPYKKSARIVGDVIGKFHPHGDTAVYDAMVRMAQKFSLRYILIKGQGNFGSIDGDAPAAMRYTEVKMSKITHYMLQDINKETVKFSLNYDETRLMPDILPTKIPNLLINGSSGIAVGMTTNIPPHNITEVITATIALIKNPDLQIPEIMQYIPGPDFPTQANIYGKEKILEAYTTGKGSVKIRSKIKITENAQNTCKKIIITDIPYQVNKSTLIENIAELAKNKKIEGIAALRDESDREGTRIVIDVKRGEPYEILINNLYSQTQMQINFKINMVALVDNKPKLLNLKEILNQFIKHRKEIIIKRTIYDINKYKKKLHILAGIILALQNIKTILKIIKNTNTIKETKSILLNKIWSCEFITNISKKANHILDDIFNHKEYKLSENQISAILELKLYTINNLEQNKLISELKILMDKIQTLQDILNNTSKLKSIICEEMTDIKKQFGDTRNSKIINDNINLNNNNLIKEEQRVITLSFNGYIKSQSLSDYTTQKRGGKGKLSTKIKEKDFVHKLVIASTHDTILCFSSLGKIFWIKVYTLHKETRSTKGKPINNILPLKKYEKITTILVVSKYKKNLYVFMATKKGIIKKVELIAFSKPRKNGIYALKLNQNDELLHVILTSKSQEIMMFSNAGKSIRFNEINIRCMSRIAKGIKGMRIKNNHHIVALIAVNSDQDTVLTTTQNGFGKRTRVLKYRKTLRGSQGVIAMSTSQKNGNMVSANVVKNDEDILLITDQGTIIRTRAQEIRQTDRSAQGVKLINLKKEEKLIGVQSIHCKP